MRVLQEMARWTPSLPENICFSSPHTAHVGLFRRPRRGGPSEATYFQDDHQQAGAHEQRDEATDEPTEPEDAIVQAHDAHGLLQPRLLLVHDALDDHSHRVNPGQCHEEGH